MADNEWEAPAVLLTVDLVILTLRAQVLHVLLVKRGVDPFLGAHALPGGFLNNAGERLEEAARRELAEEAGLDAHLLHLEQMGVYDLPGRDPRGRVVTVAYLAISPRLPEPVAGTDADRADWVPVDEVTSGRVDLAFDHRDIVVAGTERARSKLEHSPLATAFCAPTFTITELQAVYEAVWGVALDPRNFYRKVQALPAFLVPVDAERRTTGGRPARLYRAGPATALHPSLVRPGPPVVKEEIEA